ncbi:hypothetical protein SUGI_0988630 [Cryptomeria japonica]|nr:hypothetical protein SUGI_0988630 [Cryptomeria japonica]
MATFCTAVAVAAAAEGGVPVVDAGGVALGESAPDGEEVEEGSGDEGGEGGEAEDDGAEMGVSNGDGTGDDMGVFRGDGAGELAGDFAGEGAGDFAGEPAGACATEYPIIPNTKTMATIALNLPIFSSPLRTIKSLGGLLLLFPFFF